MRLTTLIALTLVIALVASCGKPGAAGKRNGVLVEITGITQEFSPVRGQNCRLIAHVTNNSDHHIQGITIENAGSQYYQLIVGELTAHQDRDFDISTYRVDRYDSEWSNLESCAAHFTGIINWAKELEPTACAMDGVSEGDCQRMVRLETALNMDAVQQLHLKQQEGINIGIADQSGAFADPGHIAVGQTFSARIYGPRLTGFERPDTKAEVLEDFPPDRGGLQWVSILESRPGSNPIDRWYKVRIEYDCNFMDWRPAEKWILVAGSDPERGIARRQPYAGDQLAPATSTPPKCAPSKIDDGAADAPA